MADMYDDLHTRMLAAGRARRSLRSRVRKAVRVLRGDGVYGMEWGDPEVVPALAYVREHFVMPYVDSSRCVLEIGPGGGRWTQYLMEAKTVYAVDRHPELLEELLRNIRGPNLRAILNHGDDFPEVPTESVDFVFSFGVFVHLDVDLIERYLVNLRRVLRPESNAVIQYSDTTKPLARQDPSFSQNDPVRMRRLVRASGYEILEEDTGSLWNSAVIRFRPIVRRAGTHSNAG